VKGNRITLGGARYFSCHWASVTACSMSFVKDAQLLAHDCGIVEEAVSRARTSGWRSLAM
jgi:hypothetical protein